MHFLSNIGCYLIPFLQPPLFNISPTHNAPRPSWVTVENVFFVDQFYEPHTLTHYIGATMYIPCPGHPVVRGFREHGFGTRGQTHRGPWRLQTGRARVWCYKLSQAANFKLICGARAFADGQRIAARCCEVLCNRFLVAGVVMTAENFAKLNKIFQQWAIPSQIGDRPSPILKKFFRHVILP